MFRITIHLKPLRSYGSIPFSYNQILATAIYNKLSVHGAYDDRFCVSSLTFERFVTDKGRIAPKPDTNVKFVASFMTKLSYQEVYESMIEKEFSIGDDVSVLPFFVTRIEKQPEINFTETINYKSISPIVVRRKQDNGNDLYLMPDDRGFQDMFFEHAYYKYIDFTGQRLDASKCTYQSIPSKSDNTKLIAIKKDRAILNIRAFNQKFKVTAPIELHQVLYFSGAGDMNNLGFGCVEIDK